ncbi:MAG TPA: DnaJ domain-containing protein [Thermoanaerobaculia bacterium]|nr:DnaJ domain-containing protein [Thermoanaerobaculia bacterium]
MKTNYYEILGVERTASEAEIRETFRRLARENHPDRYHGPDKAEAERRFQTLTEAVNVLTNPERRRQHDSTIQGVAPRSVTDFAQVAKAYLAKGVKAFKEGDFVTARENFDMAVKHNADDAKAHYYLALASARIPGALRQAVQSMEAAVQKEPMNVTYLKDAGMLARRAGLTAKAERFFEQALQWDVDNIEIIAALQELRQSRGETKEGKGLLDSLFKKG